MESGQRGVGGRILGFDGLRALAALCVFWEHKVYAGFNLGGIGVEVFFALSGYLIIGLLHRARAGIDAGSSGIGHELGRFWLRRAARIFPAYYLTLLGITLAMAILGDAPWGSDLGWYLTYTQNYYIFQVSHAWGPYTHLWTLAVEQQFYVLASLALLCSPCRHHALQLAAIVVTMLTFHAFPSWCASGTPAFASGLANSFTYMALGGLLAIVPGLAAIGTRPWGIVLGISATALAGISVMDRYGYAPPVAIPGTVRLVIPYLFSFSLLGFVLRNQQSWPVRFLEIRPLAHLGTISYGFYLYHYFVPGLSTIEEWFGFVHPKHTSRIWTIIQLAFLIGVADLSWRYIERPVLAWAQSVSGSRRLKTS